MTEDDRFLGAFLGLDRARRQPALEDQVLGEPLEALAHAGGRPWRKGLLRLSRPIVVSPM